MKVFRELHDVPSEIRTVATIGNFDGVHMGHRDLICAVVECAKKRHATSAAVTFEPHPCVFFHPDVPFRRLTSLDEKLQLFDQLGIEIAVVLPFGAEIAAMKPRHFVRQILVDTLHTEEVHEGMNFHFGRSADADAAMLSCLGVEFGFDVRIHPLLEYEGARVSSTRIRKEFGMGNKTLARQLLDIPGVTGLSKESSTGSNLTTPPMLVHKRSRWSPLRLLHSEFGGKVGSTEGEMSGNL